jgi:AbrB family looped-hinge helix DNA binding protein
MAFAGKDKFVGRMTSKGQTTVPKEVRDFLGLEEGAQVEWVLDDGKAVVKARKFRAADLAGFLGKPPSGASMTIEEMNEALGSALAEDDERIRAGR